VFFDKVIMVKYTRRVKGFELHMPYVPDAPDQLFSNTLTCMGEYVPCKPVDIAMESARVTWVAAASGVRYARSMVCADGADADAHDHTRMTIEFKDLLFTCAACAKPCGQLACGRCRNVFYCNAACQRQHWAAAHKKECARM
jgi:hypothetical protein